MSEENGHTMNSSKHKKLMLMLFLIDKLYLQLYPSIHFQVAQMSYVSNKILHGLHTLH